MTSTAGRLLASTSAPTAKLPANYEVVEEPYEHSGLADIARFVIYFAPFVEADDQDSPSARVRFAGRALARRRAAILRCKVGSIELRTDRIAWTAFRPDKRTAPLSREVGEFPFADLAVREVIRRDRSYRKKSR